MITPEAIQTAFQQGRRDAYSADTETIELIFQQAAELGDKSLQYYRVSL